MSTKLVRIRPTQTKDALGIARVHVQSWREAYAGIMPQTVLNGLDVGAREERWKHILAQPSPPAFALIAETNQDIIGFATAGPAREPNIGYDAEITSIYLLRAYQGHGLGARLFRELVVRLRREGHRSLYLWVLADNPAAGFYARMGGAPVSSDRRTFGGITLNEVAYAWSDLEGL